jgi:hypothetical protein
VPGKEIEAAFIVELDEKRLLNSDFLMSNMALKGLSRFIL